MMAEYIEEAGSWESHMVMESLPGLTDKNIKENTKMVKNKGKEHSSGLMVKFTKVDGKKVSNTGMGR